MGQRSPLVTLAAAAAGLVVLLVVNSTQTSGDSAPPVSAATTTPSETTPASTAPASTPPASTPPTSTAVVTPPAVYAGRTDGREATVAVAVKGGQAVAYVCDGRRVEAWLTGTVASGRLTLRSKAGDTLVGTVGNGVSGTVVVRGRSLPFEIDKAAPPAGLYRSQGNSAVIGWIVLADGSQVGVENDGTPAPAPRLDPARLSATTGGGTVTARSIAGDETF